jgi:hypothetical protein
MSSIQLSKNFFLDEFIKSDTAVRKGIPNNPDPIVIQALTKQATMMETIRKLLGNNKITVLSGYRCPQLNKAVGGAANSEHITGEACDFIVPAYGNPVEVAHAIAKSELDFGQLIYEGTWVHISQPGRFKRQILTATFIPGEKVRYTPGLPT